MYNRIKGFSLAELVICLILLSIGLFGFVTLNKHSVRLFAQAQQLFNQQLQQANCHETYITEKQCSSK